MSQKKESDTLRQQRFAREEFLKLKKMQQGELKAEPKPSEIYSAPLTFGEKIKNFWYHDKFFIITVAILTVCIALLVAQCSTKTEYDATVVVFTYSVTGDKNCERMGDYLKPYCKDITGDGKVNVNVVNCSLNGSDLNSEYNFNSRTKVQTLLASNANALLFITDEESYEYLSGISANDSLFEGEPIVFKDDFYEFCNVEDEFYTTPEGLQISCRNIKGTAVESDKNIDTYNEQAQNVLKGLKTAYSN